MAYDYDPSDYNKGGMIAFIFSMVFTIGFFLYLVFVHPSPPIDEVYGDNEQSTEQNTEQNAEQSEKAEGKKSAEKSDTDKESAESAVPAALVAFEASADTIALGKKVYTSTACWSCHGNTGNGKGPAGMNLIPKPRNLIEGNWVKGGSSIELFKTLTDGFGAGSSMVSYKHLSVNDRWFLVHYIRSITKNKVADDASALAEFAKTAK